MLHVLKSRWMVACLSALALEGAITTARAAIINLGDTFTPTGADYTITAVQGITSSNPLGVTGTSQVNLNFEYAGVYGVTYQSTGTGGVTQNGISLYNNGLTSGIQSVGLKIQYNSLVTASSVNVTMADFDMKNASAWGPNQKARPEITLFGASGNVIGVADDSAILANITSFTTANDGTITVNLGGLLKTLGQADQSISGYLLSASNFSGEIFQGKITDDPFMLVNAGGGTPGTSVPETSTFLPLLMVLGTVVGGHRIRRKISGTEEPAHS